jgi:GNAT superfamily N-acetyltransferase
LSEKLPDLSTPALVIQGIESNVSEFLLELGRAGGAEEHSDAHIHWVIGGSPIDYHNCVVRANLSPDSLDDVIGRVVERFRAHRVPGTWHTGPSTRPVDLGERLVRQGFNRSVEPGMAADLFALHENSPVPPGLTIKRVHDEPDLDLWVRTLAVGFGEGPREAQWVGQMYRMIGLGNHVPWRHYFAWLNGEPVATSSLFLGAGVAGIYFVFTVPSARGQGIGGAVTRAALHEARDLGYRVGVLASSAMGYSVYQRLGFQEFCHLGVYEWSLPED